MKDAHRHHAPALNSAAPLAARAPATEGTLRLRARYCECDPMGVVHHAAYIPWLEMGRTELLRTSGVTYADLEAAGVFLVIVKLECKYRRPGRYDDQIEVRTRVVAAGSSRVKIQHDYEVHAVERAASAGGLPTGAELLVAATSTLACVDKAGRIQPLPDWLAPA